jgi:hypothetical protein
LYEPSRSSDLGFNHLIDELRNATNPESGLPAEMLLKYKDLPKITVPQAVDRVADINAWRATQKAEANQLLANNAATVLHKEYPEQGMKWVELKQTGKLPENADAAGRIPVEGGRWQTHPDRQALSDALKYEGDTMGHCVGGYCPDVAEGRSRIYSLRDAKGQPHVTVETQPHSLPNKFSDLWDVAMKHVDENSPGWDEITEHGDPYEVLQEHLGQYSDNPKETLEGILQYFPEARDKTMAELELGKPSIIQIKGRGNKKPNDEYLPFVQDFVKSGKWSDVGDLNNTGLVKLDDFQYGGMDPAYLAAAKERFGGYTTMDDLIKFKEEMDAAVPAKKMAEGGLVNSTETSYNSTNIDMLADQLRAEVYG